MKFIYLYTKDTNVKSMMCYKCISYGLSRMGHEIRGICIDSIVDYKYISNKMDSISGYDCVIMKGWPQSLVKYLKLHDIPRLVIYDPPIRPIDNSRNFKGYYGICWGQPHEHYYYEDVFDNKRWLRMSKLMKISTNKWRLNKRGDILIGIRRELNFNGTTSDNIMDRLISTCVKPSRNVILCSRTKTSCKSDKNKWSKFNCEVVYKTINHFPNARCLITTGGTLVSKAILAGVPCYYTDKNIADPLSITKDLTTFLKKPSTPNRTKWYNWVAYQQWMCKEMRSGKALDYMFYVKGKVYDF